VRRDGPPVNKRPVGLLRPGHHRRLTARAAAAHFRHLREEESRA
jgi:hypothetical protein